jgi:prolipoprotein diacylglyceryltransferase
MSLLPTLDALTLFFACLAVGLGLTHLASGAAFGQESNLPWAIDLWGAIRQPTQVYEIITSLLTLGLIWIRRPNSIPGSDFLYFVALSSLSRLIIEAFRGDSTLVFGGLRLAQILAWLVLGTSFLCFELLKAEERARSPAENVDHLIEVNSQIGGSAKLNSIKMNKTKKNKAKSKKATSRSRHNH